MDNPVIDEYGNKFWYQHGNPHRDDGPAAIYITGTKSWWQYGKLHRDDGPAYENSNSNNAWYQHGKVHRDDGPAVEWPNGATLWYLNDQRLSFDKWLDKVDMSDEDKVMMKLQYG
jgi:hypothetical protein